ncbi:hypothetical protein C2845_PM02G25580 [Panicum miliaceum]|uniref:Uncharacterized protein n=1 Tax=Panicum miliaceum TaxID=4540 RepID=A0A3L6SG51_PANMI|nr:hypothetical protein C2845_PM02G25580 [Panicum miliaceum]
MSAAALGEGRSPVRGEEEEEDVRPMESAGISNIGSSLTAMTLGASSGYLPLVTLSGRVGSDTPIVGEQSGLEAVIVENNVTQIFLKKQNKDVKEYVWKKENNDAERIRCSDCSFGPFLGRGASLGP